MSIATPPTRRPAPARPRAVLVLPVLLALAALAVLLAGRQPAGAADVTVAVIVNSANPVVSQTTAEISNYFQKKKTSWPNGERVLPVDLHEQSAVREAFSRQYHGKGTAAIKAYWQKQIFSGRDVPPPEKTSVADVVAFVRANKGAVGYVPASYEAGAGVKVLQVTP